MAVMAGLVVTQDFRGAFPVVVVLAVPEVAAMQVPPAV
jgi:hypothetical protein